MGRIAFLSIFLIVLFLVLPIQYAQIEKQSVIASSYYVEKEFELPNRYKPSKQDFKSQATVTMDMSHIAIGEIGIISVSQANRLEKHYIRLGRMFDKVDTGEGYMARILRYGDPVVFMGPLSYFGPQPAHIRLSFWKRPQVGVVDYGYKIEEWKYLDGGHVQEYVSYIVIERGIHMLPDGTIIEANKIKLPVQAPGKWIRINFDYEFNSTPILLAQLQTDWGSEPAIVRVRNVNRTGFEVLVQEEEAADGWHTTEILGYIAIWNKDLETGNTLIAINTGKVTLLASKMSINHNWRNFQYLNNMPTSNQWIYLVASLVTTNGGDPCDIRYTISNNFVKLMLQEETSKDSETWHVYEDAWIITTSPIIQPKNFWAPILAGRSINVYVVNIPQATNSFVYNREDVYKGVLQAVNDANTRSIVKVPNEIIAIHNITTMEEFDYLVWNPPLRAVIINAHGEVLPLPDKYWTYEGATGGCPYVAVYGDSGWVILNNILGASEANGSDVFDYYLLDITPRLINDRYYRIAITEFENEHDFIDYLALYRIVYPSTFDIAVSPDGEIITYKYPRPPQIAVDSKGNDVLWDIAVQDNETYSGFRGDYLELTFENITPGLIKLLFVADNKNIDYNKPEIRAQLADLIEKRSLIIQIWDNDSASWVNITTIIPRNNPYMFGIDLTKYFLAKLTHYKKIFGRDSIGVEYKLWKLKHIEKMLRDIIPETLKIRILFTRPHAIDFIALENTPIKEEIGRWRQIRIWKQHLKDVEMPNIKKAKKLLKRPDGKYIEIIPGQNITALFKRDKHKTNQTYTERFLLVIRGHYKTQTQFRVASDGTTGWQPTYWQNFVKKIGDNRRNYGWVFTHVAGYPLKYLSNTKYRDKHDIGPEVIKTLLGFIPKIQEINYTLLERGVYGDLEAYENIFYLSMFSDVRGSVFIDYKNFPLATNIIYTIRGANKFLAACLGIALNGSNFISGFLAFNGLAFDTTDGNMSTDDFAKGYISSANSIECAKTYIMDPVFSIIVNGCYIYTYIDQQTQKEREIVISTNMAFILHPRLIPGEVYFTRDGYMTYFTLSFIVTESAKSEYGKPWNSIKYIDINITDVLKNIEGVVWGRYAPITRSEEKIISLHYGNVELDKKDLEPLEGFLTIGGFASSLASFIVRRFSEGLSLSLGKVALLISALRMLYKHYIDTLSLKYIENTYYAYINNIYLGVNNSCYGFLWFRVFLPISSIKFKLDFNFILKVLISDFGDLQELLPVSVSLSLEYSL